MPQKGTGGPSATDIMDSAMNLRNEFNRIGHLFHNGQTKTQATAENWAEKQARHAATAARRMREQINTGTGSLVNAEEEIVRHVRENPALYLMATALVIGALIAKLIIESRQTRRAPLL